MFYLPQGKAGMSVSNALGSNVFNVLIGLGLPYFIVQAARGRPAAVRLPSHSKFLDCDASGYGNPVPGGDRPACSA